MKSVFIIAMLIMISILLILKITSPMQAKSDLTREQVIKLAEQFIIDNGYTNFPADKSKLSFELFDEYENNIDSVLKERQNNLQPKAFCISEDTDRWNVGFLTSGNNLSKLDTIERQTNLSGRAVIVMKNGNEISMAHKDPLFSNFKKL
jgi:hypothetical protein